MTFFRPLEAAPPQIATEMSPASHIATLTQRLLQVAPDARDIAWRKDMDALTAAVRANLETVTASPEWRAAKQELFAFPDSTPRHADAVIMFGTGHLHKFPQMQDAIRRAGKVGAIAVVLTGGVTLPAMVAADDSEARQMARWLKEQIPAVTTHHQVWLDGPTCLQDNKMFPDRASPATHLGIEAQQQNIIDFQYRVQTEWEIRTRIQHARTIWHNEPAGDSRAELHRVMGPMVVMENRSHHTKANCELTLDKLPGLLNAGHIHIMTSRPHRTRVEMTLRASMLDRGAWDRTKITFTSFRRDDLDETQEAARIIAYGLVGDLVWGEKRDPVLALCTRANVPVPRPKPRVAVSPLQAARR